MGRFVRHLLAALPEHNNVRRARRIRATDSHGHSIFTPGPAPLHVEYALQWRSRLPAMPSLHFVLLSNDSYAPGLAVTLRSLLDSFCATQAAAAADPQQSQAVSIWVLDTGLSHATWQKLQAMVDADNAGQQQTQQISSVQQKMESTSCLQST